MNDKDRLIAIIKKYDPYINRLDCDNPDLIDYTESNGLSPT